MDKKRPKNSAGRRAKTPAVETEPTVQRRGSWKQRSSSVLWLKLNFTIKAARLQTLKRQKYQHLQEEALLKARGLLKNWEDGPVLLTEDLYSRARSEHEAQELLNYTPEALALRFSLRNHPDVIGAVKQLWAVELPRDAMGCIDQRGYASLFRRIGRSLEPDATKRRLRRMEKTIREDWVRDSKGEAVMSFSTFFDSVFELADLWCETIDADEYVAFLRSLVQRVSTMRRDKRDPCGDGRRLLRSLKQIKAIDDDQESSSEESEVDDEEEEEFPSEGDTDDDEEEDENVPVQLPSPTHSIGFIATKVLRTVRAKTSPDPPQKAPDTNNTPDPIDRPRSRERRASVVTLGDFNLGALGGFPGNDKDTEPKTPTGLRGSSAKSRTTSAKARTPLTSVRENGIAASAEDGGGVNALVAMHRLRSAQPRTPVVVEDAAANSITPHSDVSLNVGLPTANLPQQRQQKPTKLFSAASSTPKTTGLGTGSINSDGLLASGGLSTSSAPHLKTTGGLKAGPSFDSVDTATVGSGGARRTMLSSKSKPKGDKKPIGIAFDGAPQASKNNKRLAALDADASSTSGASRLAQNGQEGGNTRTTNGVQDENQSGPQAPREFISGLGFNTPATRGAKGGLASSVRNKAELVPVNPTMPFYTFDESASPAKRLLPPVLDESGGRGQSGAHSTRRRQRSDDRRPGQGTDLSDSYKTTGYLTGSLQAEIISRTQRSASNSRNGDARSLQQGARPLWLPVPGREAARARKQMAKQKQAPDDGYGDVTVSPWDAEFDEELDDNDLARAVPRTDPYQRVSPRESVVTISAVAAPPVVPSSQENADLELPRDPPTLSVSSSMVPAEPPSCVSELTTLPQEYHELVLGGSALKSYNALGRTESAPVIATPIQTYPVQVMSREPQWMLHGASQPSLALLEHGVEGRTVAGSPRPTLAALVSKRPRREKGVEEEEDPGLCPRFAEHLESHGDRAATAPSPLFRTDRPRPRCTCHEDDDYAASLSGEDEVNGHCPRHGSRNNNWQEEEERDADVDPHIEDVTVIVNATRGLVLRPGTMDRLAARRARHKQQATRSDMMRRRCQYTFGKHLG
ncbi:hypothetical protein PHYPSEUDO_005757 [Phytophthora pseudosyringae]|uniref:Uncharacterized protein n=1 Tax=Phytophthora pseudosyringae TaxID=221518 RepID=A0A8T1VN89_9STRA|nr:hypothetical protein PHYPSEUDO_005757 [Phytophthora pseudosyringae]